MQKEKEYENAVNRARLYIDKCRDKDDQTVFTLTAQYIAFSSLFFHTENRKKIREMENRILSESGFYASASELLKDGSACCRHIIRNGIAYAEIYAGKDMVCIEQSKISKYGIFGGNGGLKK